MQLVLTGLRRRILWILGGWLAGFLPALAFKEQILAWVLAPALAPLARAGRTLAAISPAELLWSYVNACLLAGFLISLPWTLHQLLAGLTPLLGVRARLSSRLLVVTTTSLFLAGIAFGYTLAFPMVFEFFLSLESDVVTSRWTTSSVLGFLIRLSMGFGLGFELPVVMTCLTAGGVVSQEQWSRWRRHAIVAMFVVAGVLTPSPDVISQLCLALPLIALYEVGARACAWLRRAELRSDGLPVSGSR